ncbi:MAG: hypothetical protein GY787_33295 [Alteromonadales bacterium]|nr:hypothetical protein [Alteromonadales bacterium]
MHTVTLDTGKESYSVREIPHYHVREVFEHGQEVTEITMSPTLTTKRGTTYAVALLKLLSFSVDDSNNSRVMSSASFKQRLANRKLELE